MAHAILKAHNTGDNMEELAIRFDAMASHDITYVASSRPPGPPACSVRLRIYQRRHGDQMRRVRHNQRHGSNCVIGYVADRLVDLARR